MNPLAYTRAEAVAELVATRAALSRFVRDPERASSAELAAVLVAANTLREQLDDIRERSTRRGHRA